MKPYRGQKPESPPGRKYGAAIRVRLTLEVDQAVRAARRIMGISLSQFIRAGVEMKMAELLPRCVNIADDSNANGRTRLQMIEFLRKCQKAALSLQVPSKLQTTRRVARAPKRSQHLPPAVPKRQTTGISPGTAQPERGHTHRRRRYLREVYPGKPWRSWKAKTAAAPA